MRAARRHLHGCGPLHGLAYDQLWGMGANINAFLRLHVVVGVEKVPIYVCVAELSFSAVSPRKNLPTRRKSHVMVKPRRYHDNVCACETLALHQK